MDDAPSSNAMRRTGTRTPRGPSIRIFSELGKAEVKSDISALPPPVSTGSAALDARRTAPCARAQAGQVPRVCLNPKHGIPLAAFADSDYSTRHSDCTFTRLALIPTRDLDQTTCSSVRTRRLRC